MKILLISDITWSSYTLEHLTETVNEVAPELVIVAGDIVDNKRGEFRGIWTDVLEFFTHLSEEEIEACFVRGNWDRSPWYQILSKSTLPGIHNSNWKVVQSRGLEILGIPHKATHDIALSRSLAELFPQSVDIVAAHVENRRRQWLFHLDTSVIYTGHFDEVMTCALGKLLLSTWAYPGQYVVLDWVGDAVEVEYVFAGRRKPRRAVFHNGRLEWVTAAFKDSRRRSSQIEALYHASLSLNEGKKARSELEDNLLSMDIPVAHIREYLAKPRQPAP